MNELSPERDSVPMLNHLSLIHEIAGVLFNRRQDTDKLLAGLEAENGMLLAQRILVQATLMAADTARREEERQP